MKKVLVTGSSGLLGLNFCLDHAQEHEIVGVANERPLQGVPFEVIQADLTDPGMPARLLNEVKPDVVLHTAALALPDICERRPDLASRVNARMPGELALAARSRGIQMVHISTDAVFDGQKGHYSETDATNPLNTYARSKLDGEWAVMKAYPEALIARVVFYGWSLSGDRSLSEFFYNNLSAGKPVNGFTDSIFSPLQVNDLGDILNRMIAAGLSGIYHVYSSESISKFEFGQCIARRFGLDERLINPITTADSGLAARRSTNLAMRVEKLEAALGMRMPPQSQGMDRLKRLLDEGYPQRLRSMQN